MRVNQMIDAFICLGRLLGHLRGAWRCTCELAVVVNSTTGVDEIVADAMDAGLGL